MTLEIDDRYPEFAAPYAPEDRGKHRRGLTWGGLATAALVLILATALLQPAPAPEEPASDPEPAPVITPPDLPFITPPEDVPEEPEVPPETPPDEPEEPPETPPDEPVVTQYTVTFVDWDGTIIASASYDEGTAAGDISVPADPTRADDGSYRYTFNGWTPNLADVTGDAVYTATYVATALRYYSVTFVDYDGITVLQAATYYLEGTAASDIVQPATPTRATDGTYTYTFSGWTPALSDVTADVIYTAVYDSEKNKYTITWLNYDGSTIDTTTVEQDETPVHADPTYGPTDQYTYIFIAWSPTIVPATADATYTAMYLLEERPHYYITFVDWDGTVILDETGYVEGTPASGITVPADPTRADTVAYTYAFAGWSPDLAEVTGDATYTATYTQTPIPYDGSTIELVPQIETDGTGDWPGAIFTANVALNDVAGSVGQLKLLHYNYDTKEWDEVPFFNDGDEGWPEAYVDLYAKTNEDDAGTLLSPSDKNALYDIPEDAEILEAEIVWLLPLYDDEGGWLEGHRTRDIMRLVFDYELPNGETGSAKLPEDIFYVYYDWFFEGHNDWEVDLSKKTLTLTIPYRVDRGGPLDYDSIYWYPHLYDDATGTELDIPYEITNYTEADGTVVAKIVYTFDTFVPGRAYRFNADAIYSDYGDEEHWNNWRSYTDLWGIEFPVPEYVAPDISSISNVDYTGSFAADYTAHFLPTATLNDVAGSTGRLKLLRENPSTKTFEEQALGGSNDADATDFEYYDGTEWKALDTPSNLNAEYAIPEDAEEIRASMSWSMDYPSARNVRDKMKVAFDYTLPDGTTGTVASEKYFYLYKGGFVDSNTEPVLNRDDKTITMDFTYYLDEGGDIDPNKVEWSDHRLSWKLKSETSSGYGTEIEGITPEISEYDEDGVHHVVVKYTLDEISDDYNYFYQAKVLDNEWGDSGHWNNWETDALHVNMSFPEAPTYEPPKIDLVQELDYWESADEFFVTFWANVTLNDVAGAIGQLKLMMQNPETGEWETVEFTDTEYESALIQLYTTQGDARTELTPENGPNAPYSISADADGLAIEIAKHIEVIGPDYSFTPRVREVVKLVFDYTMPNGETGSKETEEFYLYNDWFFGYGDTWVADVDSKTLTFTFPYQVDRGGPLKYDNIYWHPRLSWQPANDYHWGAEGTEVELEPDVSYYTESDGTVIGKIVYTFDTLVPNRAYDFRADVVYSDYGIDSLTHWDNWVVDIEREKIEFDIDYVEPTISPISNVEYYHGSAGSIAHVVPEVTLNDVAGSTGKLELMYEDPDDPDVWIIETLGSDEAANAVDLEYYNGSAWVALDTTSDLNAEYKIPADATKLRADMTRSLIPPGGTGGIRVKAMIAFEYTLPDNTVGEAKTNEFFLYRGSFAKRNGTPVLDRDAKTITMDFIYHLVEGGEIDPDNVTWLAHHLYWKEKGDDSDGPGTEITDVDAPQVVHSDVDGVHHVTVTYTLGSINDDWMYTYVGDVLDDEWDDPDHWNNWKTSANSYYMEFSEGTSTLTAPAFAYGPFVSKSYDGDSEDYRIGFSIMSDIPDDLKGGTASLKLMRYDESADRWVDIDFVSYADWQANVGQAVYDKQTMVGDGVTFWHEGEDFFDDGTDVAVPDPTQQFALGDYDYFYTPMMYHLPENEEWVGQRTLIKPVMEYTYPNGVEGSVELEPFWVYSGNYIRVNRDYGSNGAVADASAKTITMDFVLDGRGIDIDPEGLNFSSNGLYWQVDDGSYDSNSWQDYPYDETHGCVSYTYADEYGTVTKPLEPTIGDPYLGSDGNYHVLVTFDLNQADEASLSWIYDFHGQSYYWEDYGGYSGFWESWPACTKITFD